MLSGLLSTVKTFLGVKKKLTYTDEMKVQDQLWEDDKQDVKEMQRLHLQIWEEAKAKGFKGDADYFIVDNAAIFEIYESPSHAEKCRLGIIDSEALFSNCRSVIEHLEKLMNQEA